jgi:hypothetical protein
LLTAEPPDLDYKYEIIRRIHQERDQARAVRAELQRAQRHRDAITLVAAALVLHRIHDHDRVHECRQGCARGRRQAGLLPSRVIQLPRYTRHTPNRVRISSRLIRRSAGGGPSSR